LAPDSFLKKALRLNGGLFFTRCTPVRVRRKRRHIEPVKKETGHERKKKQVRETPVFSTLECQTFF
jgi:hypothetical protein